MSAPNASAAQAGAHTPGPWHVVNGDVVYDQAGTGIYPDEGAPLVRVATVALDHERPQEHCGKVERAANAQLIAAAPDLLAALKTITDDFEGLAQFTSTSLAGPYKRAVDSARAAISKAEGSR